jgi:hypothetical protein
MEECTATTRRGELGHEQTEEMVHTPSDGGLQMGNYRMGGGRGEKTESSGNGTDLKVCWILGRAVVITSEKKNQTGMRNRKKKPSAG